MIDPVDGHDQRSSAFALGPPPRVDLRAGGTIDRVRLDPDQCGWLVLGHDLAREVLVHPGLTERSTRSSPATSPRLRRVLDDALSQRRVDRMAPRIQQIADELLDVIAPLGEADLMQTFTDWLPLTVIAELLGVPEDHRAEFRRQALETPGPLDGLEHGGRREQADGGEPPLAGYLRELLAERRRSPGDDLLSTLIASCDDEVIDAVLLLVAGQVTASSLLARTIRVLLDSPQQADRLRPRPDLLADAVRELFSHHAPVETTQLRCATEDVLVAGHAISSGELVLIPGIRSWFGASLAQLEIEIALDSMLARLRELVWAPTANRACSRRTDLVNGPRTLAVRYRPEPVIMAKVSPIR